MRHFNYARRGRALAAISGKVPSVSGVWIAQSPTREAIGMLWTSVRGAFSRSFHCDSMKHKVILHLITMKYAVSRMKCLTYGSPQPPYSHAGYGIFHCDSVKYDLMLH